MGYKIKLNNLVKSLWTIYNNAVRFTHSMIAIFRLKCFGVDVGKGLSVRGWLNLHISPSSEVVIGDKVMLKSGFADNPTACSARTGICCRRGSKLFIGNKTGVFGTTIICCDSITIGSDTLIAGGTHIYDTNFHSLDAAVRNAENDSLEQALPVKIGDKCWIGSRCIILRGITIGDEAVIGAGSVVTKDVPPRQVWAGNPAKFVKEIN